MSTRLAPWSAREDATLSKIYPSHGVSACKERLGRSASSIYARAHQLGLTEPRKERDPLEEPIRRAG